MDIAHLSVSSIRTSLEQKEFSAAELASEFLRYIDQTDKHYRAFLRTRVEVLDEAKAVDERLASGQP
jgi:Asp-tRNA(Asn)/Glu-tRNA(Gln) amidotransferase A subunit family amidase